MRFLIMSAAIILLLPFAASAQDPAAQSAQLAMQAAQLASDQASQQAAQQAMQASQLSAQQAMQDAQTVASTPCCVAYTYPPKFSVKPGSYSSPTTVKITDASRGAIIYYTTDGWTPTPASPRYRGPITIDSFATLEAVAVAPYSQISQVASARYEIAGNTQTAPSTAAAQLAPSVGAPSGNAIPVYLAFAATVNSQTASVGDTIPMTLAEDLQYGNELVKKGATATVTITAVDKNGAGGLPGVLGFEADFLQAATGPIHLAGFATREGKAKPPNAAVLIPVVGPLTVFKHGDPAVIDKGTPFTAYIDPASVSADAQQQLQN